MESKAVPTGDPEYKQISLPIRCMVGHDLFRWDANPLFF
jgi:hypothetical protein